jgi:hypothetical protein
VRWKRANLELMIGVLSVQVQPRSPRVAVRLRGFSEQARQSSIMLTWSDLALAQRFGTIPLLRSRSPHRESAPKAGIRGGAIRSKPIFVNSSFINARQNQSRTVPTVSRPRFFFAALCVSPMTPSMASDVFILEVPIFGRRYRFSLRRSVPDAHAVG